MTEAPGDGDPGVEGTLQRPVLSVLPHETAYSWVVAAVTLIVASVSFGAVTSVPILLTPLVAEWGESRSTVALIHTSGMFGGGTCGLVMGRWVDRSGFFGIALVGAIATGGGLMLASHATSIWQLYLVYGLLIGGLGQGVFFGPLAAAVSHWFDRHSALAIAIAASGQSVGGLIVPPLMRVSAAQDGWREALFAYGAFSTIVLLIGSLAFIRDPPFRGKADRANTSELQSSSLDGTATNFASREFLYLRISMGFTNVSMFMVLGHVTAFGEEIGLSPVDAAGLLSILLGVTLFSRLSSGYLADRWGKYPVLVAVSILHTVGVARFSAAQTYQMIVLGVVLIGLGFGGYLPGYAVLVRGMFPREQTGRRIAEIYFVAFISAGVGSWCGGVLRDVGGQYSLAFYGALVSSATGFLVLLSRRNSFSRASLA